MSAGDVIRFVKQQEPKFRSLDKANGNLVDFEKECLFARQQLLKSDFTLKVASENPDSLQAAVLNVASIGITLNPANQHAFLVPRDGRICLDISFRGLVYLATDSGAIKWAKAELVYANDDFEWQGPTVPPSHRADPFSEDRGELKGGYVIAKMPDGEVMVETMSAAEINKVRDTSKAYQKHGGPWVTWYEEMAKKTLIKRAYKSWPQTPARRRLDSAVEVLHDTEGTRYTIEQHQQYMKLLHDGDALKFYAFRMHVGDETWASLFNSFAKGEKTKLKARAREMEKEGTDKWFEIRDAIAAAIEAEDEHGVREVLDELDEVERLFVEQNLPPESQQFIEGMEES